MKRHFTSLFGAMMLVCGLVATLSAQTLKTDEQIEAMGYTHIYQLNIGDTANYTNGAPYTIDNSSLNLGPLESVAYRLNLDSNNFAFVSMASYTNDLTKIGVPTLTSGSVQQRYVQNLYYEAKSPTLTTAGTTVSQGNIEFWPYNYDQYNTASIPNAQGTKTQGETNRTYYDFGDRYSYGGTHGSMQVHDYQNKRTVFAFNNWNADQQSSLGIGNNNNGAGKDWTFVYNAASYDTKQLDVYAKPVFSQMSESDYSAISSEASKLSLVYKLDCPLYGTYSANNYTINKSQNSEISGMPLSRVAYYMTLEKADGSVDYAYAAYDATTNDLSQIGLPFNRTVQTKVSNMTVQSNVEGVVNGSGITTGNIEMTYTNYNGNNKLNIPNASSSTWDFGDAMETTGNYACFQIHNYEATNPDGSTGQTVMALNRWNGSATGTNNTIDIGIGNNPKAGQKTTSGSTDTLDYTFNGSWGTSSNASQYTTRSLYVLAEAAIAPGMANVKNASDYTIVQGARLTSQMSKDWNTQGVDYDIVNNVSQLQSEFGPIDRVGYYMEYANNASDSLKYVFVSFDAMTDDISKIGVPTATSGEYYKQVVHNLEITTNVSASEGKINDTKTGTQVVANTTISQSRGYLEFWPSNYATKKDSVISNGSDTTYDINDSGSSTSSGHGSMQVHSLDTNQTIFAVNAFATTKQFGIGTNPNSSGHPDWTFDSSKSGYAIANIYTFAKPVLSDMNAEQYAEIKSEATDMHLIYKLDCPLQGTYSANNYTVNNAASSDLNGMPLGRVAYYMKLEKSDGTVDYAYASYDAQTNDLTKIGLPFNNQYVYQTKVSNLTVQSNVAGVVNGTGIQTGNIEIWNQSYVKTNSAGIDGASDYSYDFGDKPSGGGYGSFQIHNYGAQQTVMSLSAWNGQAKGNTYIDIGIGNNPNTTDSNYQPDYTFNGQKGANSNAAQYTSRTLYIMAEAAIAPGMANVSDASDYTLVQGARLTNQMSSNWQTGSVNYNIVDNLSTLQQQGVLFDRVGYYMEYAQNASDDLKYVFVSFDAMTDDISKIGVPTASTGEFYQQTVNNLEITTNVSASQGLITDPDTGKQIAANTTISQDKGYIEFWSASYGAAKSGVVEEGSATIYDINDSPNRSVFTEQGYGSMQIHSLETGQTIFALNNFSGTKAYGIGTNPNAASTTSGNKSQADWTFDSSKSGYAIANIYTYVHTVDALLTTQEYSLFQRNIFNVANVKLSGTWATTNGVEIKSIQASVDDGETWTNLVINSDGTFSGNMTLTGGLYDVQYQALDGSGNIVATKSGQVGVGEIFITAGQSNSTNYGDACQTSSSGMAFAYNPDTGKWEVSGDPQYGSLDKSNKGSMWPSFADTLAAEEGVPVGTYSVGYGGTSLTQWLNDWKPSGSDIGIYSNLKAAMEYLNENADGFAGILWHQGESDASAKTTEDAYYDMLTTLIARTREDSGIEDLPWGIAIASALSDGTTNSAITNAQMRVIEDDLMAFLGVNTDDFFATEELANLLRGQNGNSIHLSEDGLWLAGYLMAMTAGKDIAALHHIPEPSTWALLILGVAGLYWMRRRNGRR